MSEVCTLIPTVKGKKSKLYEALSKATKKNRPLTNLLYALALQDKVKDMFSPSDFNSQGELSFSAFSQKVDLDSILDTKNIVQQEAIDLGAINEKGERVYIDNPDSIVQKVIDFNTKSDKIKATINYDNNGYYINVDTINAENYNTNNSLKTKLVQFEALNQALENAGLNTEVSEQSKKVFNIINSYYIINKLTSLRGENKAINKDIAQLLVELFKDDVFIKDRLQPLLGDDLAQVLSQESGFFYEENEFIPLDSQTRGLLQRFLTQAGLKLSRALGKDFRDHLEATKANINYENVLLDANSKSVMDTLKHLYTTYQLDKNNLNALTGKIAKISEAAQRLLQIQITRDKELRLRFKTANKNNVFLKTQKEIDNGRYLLSITIMLHNLLNTIKSHEARIQLLDEKLKEHPDSLKVIRQYSQILLDQLDTVASYEDIMNTLANVDLIEINDDNANSKIVSEIQESASELLKVLGRIKTNARSKQYDVVYSFLKIYWGEDKVLSDGTKLSLDGENGIMNIARKDINLFDRFLYAVNTTNDEMLNLMAEAVKQANEKRDTVLRDQVRVVRGITNKLYKSGSDTSFMYEKDENGHPVRIISDYDWARYDKELEEYKKSLKDSRETKEDTELLIQNWIQKHSKSIKYEYTTIDGKKKQLEMTVPIYNAPLSIKDRLSPEQYEYYKVAMGMKAEVLSQIDVLSNDELFNVIEIADNFTDALANGNTDVFSSIKNQVLSAFTAREDEESYGSILDANDLKLTHINSRGEPIYTLPLFYRNKIKDRSRVSTDFSKSLMAYLSANQQYIQMNNILDALLLTKDWMLQVREVQTQIGGHNAIDRQSLGKKQYVIAASKKGFKSSLNGLTEDFFERLVYSRLRKDEGCIFGSKIKWDKAVDMLTGYTSVAGLAVNFLGAEANLLVGKLQMLIETGLGMGGEFFNMKDMFYADAKYFQMLAPVLNEVNSNNKTSLLGLMMERFDVLDDFYEKMKETGFYKTPLAKIIGNKNLFVLYGLGEHLLHAQGMLAVLHNKKNMVLDDSGKEVPIIEAFETQKDEYGGTKLAIKKGYTLKDGSAITEEHINKLKRRIAYVNKSMHGAFGTADKGMIHRYAVGRLIMNFRQWMPAHYQRRFRGEHYDTDLGELREGYYVSMFKFLNGCASELKSGKFDLAANWNNLTEMQKYNVKRTIAEVAIMAALTAMVALLGNEKDHKGNWARRHLIYETKRMLMETKASSPVAGYGFVKNIVTTLNSPVASMNTLEKLCNVVNLTDAFITIENGKYKGDNLYVHNLEMSLPFYGQIMKTVELGDDSALFNIFN